MDFVSCLFGVMESLTWLMHIWWFCFVTCSLFSRAGKNSVFKKFISVLGFQSYILHRVLVRVAHGADSTPGGWGP